MKMISRLLVVLTATLLGVFCAPNAGGQVKTVVAPPDSFPFGSMEKVENYAVSKVNWIGLYVWAYGIDNEFVPFPGSQFNGYPGVTNKAELEVFIANKLAIILKKFLTNTSNIYHPDKSKGLVVIAPCEMFVNGIGSSEDIFGTPQYISIKPILLNGILTVPDQLPFSLKINAKIPFHIPNLKWARLEVRRVGDVDPFEVDDRNIDQTTDLLSSDGFLYLPTDVITDSSQDDGSLRLKLSIASRTGIGYFRSFDGDGTLLQETPMLLDMSRYGEDIVAITVKGGDSGRAFVLQQSSDGVNWVNANGTNFISAFQHLGVQPQFNRTMTDKMLYRTKTVNAIP